MVIPPVVYQRDGRKLAGFAALLLRRLRRCCRGRGRHRPRARRRDTSAERGTPCPRTAASQQPETAADPVRGLAVYEGGLELAAATRRSCARGRPAELRFSILGADGQPVRDFEVEHEKRMHLIVVRRDGQGFQHLHPELGDDGIWSVRLTLPEAGSYRVFADFKHDGEAQTLGGRPGRGRRGRLPAAAAPATSADDRPTATWYAWTPAPRAPAARRSCASRSAATASRSAPSPTWAPAVTSWRCARATSRTSTCILKAHGDDGRAS